MSNLYHDSENYISDLRDGRAPLGSIVELQWPSGNGEYVRFHGWNFEKGVMIGCGMGWDNGATRWYDLSKAVVQGVEQPKEELCDKCNKRVHMWHKHAMWCSPENPYPLTAMRGEQS